MKKATGLNRWGDTFGANLCRMGTGIRTGILLLVFSVPLLAQTTTADSAGITVVTNATPFETLPRWVVSDTPGLTIGGIDADENAPFTFPNAVQIVGDSLVLVADAMSGEIRLFDLEGNFLSRMGGDGEGPGEYRGLGSVSELGPGTFAAYDYRLGRITEFSLDGTILNTALLELPAGVTGNPTVIGAGDSNVLYTMFTHGSGPPGQVATHPATFFRYSVTGTPNDSVASVPGLQWITIPAGQGRFLAGPRPFSPRPAFGVRGSRFYLGNTAEYSISLFVGGRQSRIIRRTVLPQPVAGRMKSDFNAANGRANFDDDAFPEMLPEFESLRVDAMGYLWVARTRAEGSDELQFDVFDANGVLTAAVVLPSGSG